MSLSMPLFPYHHPQFQLALLGRRLDGLRVAATRLVVDHVGTEWYVPLCGLLIESSLAVRALNVVGVLRWWWRRQISQLAAASQMRLHLLGGAYGLNELLMLLAPIALLHPH